MSNCSFLEKTTTDNSGGNQNPPTLAPKKSKTMKPGRWSNLLNGEGPTPNWAKQKQLSLNQKGPKKIEGKPRLGPICVQLKKAQTGMLQQGQPQLANSPTKKRPTSQYLKLWGDPHADNNLKKRMPPIIHLPRLCSQQPNS